MAKFEYFVGATRKVADVEVCDTPLKKMRGLMFRKTTRALLFPFSKEKKLAIHSFFCRPFVAIWLNSSRRATKICKVKPWRTHVVGYGKYLLEIPTRTTLK